MRQTSPVILARSDSLCELAQSCGRGMTLPRSGDAHALARHLEESEPDPERVELFRQRLGQEADPMMDQLIEPEEIVPRDHDRAVEEEAP